MVKIIMYSLFLSKKSWPNISWSRTFFSSIWYKELIERLLYERKSFQSITYLHLSELFFCGKESVKKSGCSYNLCHLAHLLLTEMHFIRVFLYFFVKLTSFKFWFYMLSFLALFYVAKPYELFISYIAQCENYAKSLVILAKVT